MVVLGGSGDAFRRARRRLPLHAARLPAAQPVADEERIQDLPDVLRIPLSEPLFLLGALFVAVVFFVPGGLSSLPARIRLLVYRQAARSEASVMSVRDRLGAARRRATRSSSSTGSATLAGAGSPWRTRSPSATRSSSSTTAASARAKRRRARTPRPRWPKTCSRVLDEAGIERRTSSARASAG